VLDEPTIGLHARDNQILLDALHKLGDKGNTLVVVEHDEDTIRRADHIIDIGPSAGKRGGRVVARRHGRDITAQRESLTGRYLLHAMKHPLQGAPRTRCTTASLRAPGRVKAAPAPKGKKPAPCSRRCRLHSLPPGEGGGGGTSCASRAPTCTTSTTWTSTCR
jgi:excinuclease ABC subunit A